MFQQQQTLINIRKTLGKNHKKYEKSYIQIVMESCFFSEFDERFFTCPRRCRYRRASAPCRPRGQPSGVGSAGEAEAVGRGSDWRTRAEERELPGPTSGRTTVASTGRHLMYIKRRKTLHRWELFYTQKTTNVYQVGEFVGDRRRSGAGG